MRKDRLSYISGFMPPLCMAFMLGFEYLTGQELLGSGETVVALAEVLPFLLPLMFVAALGRLGGSKLEQWSGGFSRKAVPFVLFMSVATAFASFLLNSGVSLLLSESPGPQVPYLESISSVPAAIVLIVILPGIFEELLFRGGLMAAFSAHGTFSAIFLSALTFALIHGSVYNLAGPFAAGMVYGYMAYTLGSVWPAVLAHMVNNAFYLSISYVARAYDTLGIWPYFLLITAIMFGLFLFLSMRSLEKLIEKGKARRFQPSGVKGMASGLLFTPGVWLLGLMYLIRIAYT